MHVTHKRWNEVWKCEIKTNGLQINAQNASLRSLVACREHIAAANAASKGPPTVFVIDLKYLQYIQYFFIPYQIWPLSNLTPYNLINFSLSNPLFLCRFWISISIVDWNESVPQFLGDWPWPLTLECHLRSKNIFTIRKPIHDFLSITFIDTFYLIPFLRYLISKFSGFDLDF